MLQSIVDFVVTLFYAICSVVAVIVGTAVVLFTQLSVIVVHIYHHAAPLVAKGIHAAQPIIHQVASKG